MKETKKQLNDLIRTFYGESEARQITGDIEEADALISAFESPMPRAGLAEQIKEKLIRQAARRHRKTLALRSMLSAAAACLLVGAGLIMYHILISSARADLDPRVVQAFFSEQPVEKITSNLDEISEQIHTTQSSGSDSLWEVEVVEEIEEMDRLTNSDFWKG